MARSGGRGLRVARARFLAQLRDQHRPSLPVDGPLVTFTFRATLRGQVLAQASEAAWASEPTTACDPLRLTISGREQAALLDGASVIQEAQAMLGVSLHRPLR